MPKLTSGVATAPLPQIDTPLLAVALAQGSAVPASLADLDRAAGGIVARAITSGDFKGKRDETTLLYPSGAKPERVLLVGLGKPGEVTRTTIRRGAAVAAGHRLTRYLQMLPGNVCTPSYLAERAKQLADQYGFTLTVLDRAKLEQERMGALLAVAQGSDQEPRFIVLEHRGGGDAPPVALIGKGVTFDSGGISIKPAQNMEDMKFDMSGAAAVLGTFETLG